MDNYPIPDPVRRALSESAMVVAAQKHHHAIAKNASRTQLSPAVTAGIPV